MCVSHISSSEAAERCWAFESLPFCHFIHQNRSNVIEVWRGSGERVFCGFPRVPTVAVKNLWPESNGCFLQLRLAVLHHYIVLLYYSDIIVNIVTLLWVYEITPHMHNETKWSLLRHSVGRCRPAASDVSWRSSAWTSRTATATATKISL